jgi:6-pyruvoyltetrahydropterin/6-carboxytetrahydropterin synthase
LKFLIELGDLKELVEERVIQDVDHHNLNVDVPWMSDLNPTTENLAVAIWDRLAGGLPEGVRLERIVVWETPRNRVEYRGE